MGNILVMKNLYFSNETYISWGKKPGFLQMFYDVPWDKRIISMRGNGIPQEYSRRVIQFFGFRELLSLMQQTEHDSEPFLENQYAFCPPRCNLRTQAEQKNSGLPVQTVTLDKHVVFHVKEAFIDGPITKSGSPFFGICSSEEPFCHQQIISERLS